MSTPPNVLLRLTVTLLDDESVKAPTHQYLEIPNTATLVEIATIMGDWATAIANITDGGFVRAEANIVYDPASDLSLRTTPSGSEECSETGEFQYSLTGSTTKWTAAVPTLTESVTAGNGIDTTNTHIIAYNTLLTSALLTSGFFCAPDGLELHARSGTFLGTRKHRRQQHLKSFQAG